MKKSLKKIIAIFLTVAMAMGATVPAYADSETSQIDLNSLPGIVQFDMTVQEKQQINDDLMYLKQFDIFEYGELISVNLDSSEQNTKNMVYTIDYDDFLEKIIVDKHSKESTKLIISQNEIVKMVCWICLYFSPPFQSTRTARYSSHRRSGCHRPATPQCSSQCIRDRRCRCRSACSVCIFRRSSFVLLSSTGFLFLYILIITLLVAKVKFFPKKFCQKGT